MKKKPKSKLPFTKKPKKKYFFPVPFPPCSVISVRRKARSPWADEVGRRFRIGNYSKMDSLDCIWLVDGNGKYDQTIDHESLNKFSIFNPSPKNAAFTNVAVRSSLP